MDEPEKRLSLPPFFFQLSKDFVSCLPRVLTEERMVPLLPAVSKLLFGLLRLHGLPPAFTYNPRIFDHLVQLPPADPVEVNLKFVNNFGTV